MNKQTFFLIQTNPVKKNKSVILVFSLVFVLISSISCIKQKKSGSSFEGVTDTEILLGAYNSMTGSESDFGVSAFNGITIAMDRINKNGGIKGRKLRLINYDDQGKSDEAVTAITKLITHDQVLLVLGEVASSRSIAAGAVAQRYKVPMVSTASTNPKVTQIGDYIFRVCFTDAVQGKALAQFAVKTLKAKTTAVFRDMRSDYSIGLANYFIENFKKLGGVVPKGAEVTYQGGDIDFKAQLNIIKGFHPDLVYVPGYYTEVGLIVRQGRELQINVPFLGGDGWDSPQYLAIGGKATLNTYFGSHYSAQSKDPTTVSFVKEYKKRFGEVPNSLAAMGYDGMVVVADAIKRAPDFSRKSIRDALATTKNVRGATGVISINDQRDAVKPVSIIKVLGIGKIGLLETITP